MLGSFHDEYGREHTSGRPSMNITRWEVGNEVMAETCRTSNIKSYVSRHSLFQVDYEHGHTAASYTLEYDAIVAGIWRLADPFKRLLFRLFYFNKYIATNRITVLFVQRPCTSEHR
jgi:hypothetical protein